MAHLSCIVPSSGVPHVDAYLCDANWSRCIADCEFVVNIVRLDVMPYLTEADYQVHVMQDVSVQTVILQL